LSESLLIREALGERRVTERDLPLAVGGAGSDIRLASAPEGPVVHLGIHEGELFVQPAAGHEVLHNGIAVAGSAWLHAGDVLDVGSARLRLGEEQGERVLVVEDGAAGNITAPPVITASARISGAAADDEAEDRIEAISFRAGEAAAPRRSAASPARWIVLGVVALLAFAAWFVFTGTSVEVATEPSADTVAFSRGLPAIEIGGRYLMRPGTYLLRAERAGYVPVETEVEVERGSNQRFEFVLEKLPGILQIDVPVAAAVRVDGESRGTAPGAFELKPGKHSVTITADRYLEFTTTVDIEGEGRTQSLAPQLEPAWAVVTVTSEPAGAEVVVDGELRGVTPLETEVLAGNRPLELRLEGFKPWLTDLQVRAGEPLEVGPVRLGLPDGRLSVRSEPSGASVTVAGVYRGTTPLELEVRPEVAQSIVLARPGYESARRQVTLQPGEQRTLNVDLAGVYGKVTVRAEPADAELYVDGRRRGAANQTLELTATTHQIEIRKPGFESFKTEVTPRPGLPQLVETRLLTPAQARVAALATELVTAGGQQLKLMPVGRYTMGSSRREPGRRANEAQREVVLERRFYFGTRQVTNAEFRKFVSGHRSGFVGPNSLDLERQPVVKVTWQQAAAFCNWLSEQDGLPPAYVKQGATFVPAKPMTTGYRLPSEAEWEFVARYVDGSAFRRYPWGDALPVAPRAGNFADQSARAILASVIPDYDDGYPVTAPVGSFAPNPLGVFDAGSNVAEWAHDVYTVSLDAAEAAKDPLGPDSGAQHVIRGASWRSSSVTDLRLMSRGFGDGVRDDVGFRIARYAE
jgi:formylglycine-generating enzyme required for sulfatase activity